MHLTELFPRQARVADKFSIVRSLHHGSGDHFTAGDFMLSGRGAANGGDTTSRYPSIGSIAAKELGNPDFPLPSFVSVGARSYGSGFLGTKYQPLVVNDANRGVENLKAQSKEVSGKEDIARVGTVVSREREIGDVIADAIEKVGKDGVVNVEEGQTFGLDLEFTEGMQFDKGYLSPYMITDAERMPTIDASVPPKIGPTSPPSKVALAPKATTPARRDSGVRLAIVA